MANYYKASEKQKLDTDTLDSESWKNTDGIPLGVVDGKLIKRDTFSPKNLMLFGLPGFNKTTGSIATAALRFGATLPDSYYERYKDNLLSLPMTKGSTVVIDIKGDILHWTRGKRRIKIFDPSNPNSCHFNPFHNIEKMSLSDRRVFLENMANIIVQDEKDGKYFTDGGRDFFCGVCHYTLSKNIHTSFIDVVNLILHDNGIDWVKRVVNSDCDEAKDYLSSYYGSNEKNVSGCYGALAKELKKFKNGALPNLLNEYGECISSDLLDEGWDIYIEIPQDMINVYSSITTILIQQLMDSFMQRTDSSSGAYNRPILFILDEMPKLRFDFFTIENCLSTMRSKNVSCILAAQSVGQYKERYSENKFVNLVDCCQYICCLSALEPSSRKWFSDLIGTKKVLKRTTSPGDTFLGNVSVQEGRELVIQPEEFSMLDDKAVIYIVGEGYVIANKCKVYE